MINDFEQIVFLWEEHEIFYKELYEKSHGDKKEYQYFLNQLDVEALRNKGIVVPDLYEPFDVFGEITPIFDLDTDIDENGWYIRNGKVNFSYTGYVKANNIRYSVRNGRVAK